MRQGRSASSFSGRYNRTRCPCGHPDEPRLPSVVVAAVGPGAWRAGGRMARTWRRRRSRADPDDVSVRPTSSAPFALAQGHYRTQTWNTTGCTAGRLHVLHRGDTQGFAREKPSSSRTRSFIATGVRTEPTRWTQTDPS